MPKTKQKPTKAKTPARTNQREAGGDGLFATAEQIDSSVFIPISQDTTVPASWEEKARQ